MSREEKLKINCIVIWLQWVLSDSTCWKGALIKVRVISTIIGVKSTFVQFRWVLLEKSKGEQMVSKAKGKDGRDTTLKVKTFLQWRAANSIWLIYWAPLFPQIWGTDVPHLPIKLRQCNFYTQHTIQSICMVLKVTDTERWTHWKHGEVSQLAGKVCLVFYNPNLIS